MLIDIFCRLSLKIILKITHRSRFVVPVAVPVWNR